MKIGPSWVLGGPNYDVKLHLQYVRGQFECYDLNTSAKCEEWSDLVAREIGKPELRPTIHALFEGDEIYRFSPPTLEDRAYLTRQGHQLSEDRINSATGTIVRFFRGLVLPPSGESSTSVPRHILTPDFAVVIARIHNFFIKEATYGDYQTFPRLADRLADSWYRLSGVPRDAPNTKSLTGPLEYGGNLMDYLEGTPFYDFFQQPVPFEIPRDLFASHTFICAPPRHGKTQLLGSFIARFLQDPDSPGLFILDPHGDLFLRVQERVPPERLVVLDPETDPPPMNIFHGIGSGIAAYQSFEYLISSLSGGLSDKQAGLAPYLFALMREMSAPTLDTLRNIVEDPAKKAEQSALYPYIQKLQPRAQDFFRNQFFSSIKESRQAIAWKIYAAMGSDAFAKMFSSSENVFDAYRSMQERRVVIARGSENTLGEHGLPIFLQFIVSQCLMGALRRANIPESERHLALLICDEAKHVFNDQTERILTECRKYNLGYIAATQVLSQIPEGVRSAVFGATAIKITGGSLQTTDADRLGREMFTDADFIRSMQPVRGSHADWAMHIQEVTPGRAVKVRVPYGQLEAMPKMHERPANAGRPAMPESLPQRPAETPRTSRPEPRPPTRAGSPILDALKERLRDDDARHTKPVKE